MTIIKKSADKLSLSQKRLKKLAALSDDDIDYSDIPELDASFWEEAVVRFPQEKEHITARFDADMVAWFKKQGRGYQGKMNAVLRSYYEVHKGKNTDGHSDHDHH